MIKLKAAEISCSSIGFLQLHHSNSDTKKNTNKMDQEVCVTWKEYQKKGDSIFEKLLETSEFADITLVSEDGQQFKGHKVLLGFFCPFFMELLKRSDHPHPLVHMVGVKSAELSALLEFLYKGETTILQRHLEPFLLLAKKLRLSGLAKTEELSEEYSVSTSKPKTNEDDKSPSVGSNAELRSTREELVDKSMPSTVKVRPDEVESEHKGEVTFGGEEVTLDNKLTTLNIADAGLNNTLDNEEARMDNKEATTNYDEAALDFEMILIEPDIETAVVSQPDQPKSKRESQTTSRHEEDSNEFKLEQLENQIDSLLEQQSPNSYGCKVCGKTTKTRREVRCHIERAHVEGFVHYCDTCGKAHRNRQALSEHMMKAGHRPPKEPTEKVEPVLVRPENIDGTIKSMMEYGKDMGLSSKGKKIRLRICKVCGKEGVMNNIMKHIERYHIQTGVPNSCRDCKKTFETRVALMRHQKGVFCFSKQYT